MKATDATIVTKRRGKPANPNPIVTVKPDGMMRFNYAAIQLVDIKTNPYANFLELSADKDCFFVEPVEKSGEHSRKFSKASGKDYHASVTNLANKLLEGYMNDDIVKYHLVETKQDGKRYLKATRLVVTKSAVAPAEAAK